MDNLEIENIGIIMEPDESGESVVLLAELKLNLNVYLNEQLLSSPVSSLADIIAFNKKHSRLVNTPEKWIIVLLQ